MKNMRIENHPIIVKEKRESLSFTWNGEKYFGQSGETISAALIANQIQVFSHHPKNNAPQGIYCANGQCAQCMIMCNAKPVKACMTEIQQDMALETLNGLPKLLDENPSTMQIINKCVQILIVGGGPAGLSAAKELTKQDLSILLTDDKNELGGKLTLQTHRFFGSVEDVHAGSRGIEIGHGMQTEALANEKIEIWLNSPCVAVFSDKKIGIIKENKQYALISAEAILFTTGAREKTLKFPGNSLPGIYGAGAFQTLVNRDQVIPSENLLIIGGGNVGLIAGYHALQADINIACLVEAAPKCGGYKVHHDKLKRLGVPILTSHTVVEAYGENRVDGVLIAEVDQNFKPIAGTEKKIACDTVLIAVGLSPVDELTKKAKEFGMNVFEAGDCKEIAEASAAIFSGKLVANDILKSMSIKTEVNEQILLEKFSVLKSHPGRTKEEFFSNRKEGVYPVFHCVQEIPCNPCVHACPLDLIKIDSSDIRKQPKIESIEACIGCAKCLVNCSGLAITLVDYRKSQDTVRITLPCEFTQEQIGRNPLDLVDMNGNALGTYEIVSFKYLKNNNHTRIIQFDVKPEIAQKVAGFKLPSIKSTSIEIEIKSEQTSLDSSIICRCEQVTEEQIRELIQSGIHDLNQLKALTRAGMGACQGKTCTALILQIMREEGVSKEEITMPVERPLFMDIPLHIFHDQEGESNE